jgi:hypothetical protein
LIAKTAGWTSRNTGIFILYPQGAHSGAQGVAAYKVTAITARHSPKLAEGAKSVSPFISNHLVNAVKNSTAAPMTYRAILTHLYSMFE